MVSKKASAPIAVVEVVALKEAVVIAVALRVEVDLTKEKVHLK